MKEQDWQEIINSMQKEITNFQKQIKIRQAFLISAYEEREKCKKNQNLELKQI